MSLPFPLFIISTRISIIITITIITIIPESKFSDVTFELTDGSRLQAHRLLLALGSARFQQQFKGEQKGFLSISQLICQYFSSDFSVFFI